MILPSDALVGNIQDLSPYLQEVAHRINDKYEKRVDAKLKIAPNRLDAIRSELRADGYLKDAGSLALVNRMILAHQNHIDQVFHAKKISKLKKSIVANWDIERMNITQREYLAFVLKSIKTWFDKHTKMREA